MRRDAHHYFRLILQGKLVGLVCSNVLIGYNLTACSCSHDIISHDWLSTEGFIDETVRANQIMGDVCDANDMLLLPNGDDSNLVTKAEQNAGDLSQHTYTQHDKMVLRQFEGASAPAKYLCLFL